MTAPGPGLWLLPVDGSGPRPAHYEPSPSPGPPGSWPGWVAYTADGTRYGNVVHHFSWGGGGYTTVEVGEVDGPSHQVETSTTYPAPLVWSPDGTRLAYFGQDRQTGAKSLYVYDVEDRTERLVWSGGGSSVLVWTADGRQLLRVFNHPEPGVDDAPITAESGIWLIDVDTGEQRRVVSDPVIGADLSPDGTRLVFNRHGTFGVWVVDIDGTNRRRLTDDGHTPRWSPNGRIVAYRTSEGTSLVDPDGPGGVRFFTPHKLMSWAPDGDQLLVWATDAVQALSLDGCVRELLARQPLDHQPIGWGPGGTVVLASFHRVSY